MLFHVILCYLMLFDTGERVVRSWEQRAPLLQLQQEAVLGTRVDAAVEA